MRKLRPLPSIFLALAAVLAAPERLADAGNQLEPDDLTGPTLEVVAAKGEARVAVPALPSFELPATEPGFTTPRELSLRGRRKLGSDVKVKGYVTWVYDCAAALAAQSPRAPRAALQKKIDADPSICERPRFTLGDAKGAPRDASITVVEVPRPPTKRERQQLDKAALAAWPAAPKLAVGDYVVVSGQWTTRAPRGDASPDGLLVYSALTGAALPGAVLPSAAPAATSAETTSAEADVAVVTEAPLRKVISSKLRADSINQLGACHRAATAGDFGAAIRACRTATATWEGNHLAWYTLASAHMALGQWPEARATVARSVALRPDLAMYQLYHGVAIYEEELQIVAATAATAGAAGKARPEVTSPALVAARDALRRAAKLNPALWRAHFYLARVYRDLDEPRRAAEQFVATMQAHPSYRYAYLSLVELLRRWGYIDSALAFAQLGAERVTAAEAADLWIEVGVLCEQRKVEDQALEAYGKALAARPDDARAKLQRGQLRFRTGDLAGAKADLEAALASSDPQLVANRAYVKELLARIAARKG